MMKTSDSNGGSLLEAQVASELWALVAEIPIGAEFTVAPSSELSSSLELFLPMLLSHHHLEWTKESLDGVFVALARKTGSESVQIAGTCILISDQTVTPFLLYLSLSSSHTTITAFRVYLGEPGGGSLGISGPECNSKDAKRLLATLSGRLSGIKWTYKIASGDT